MICTRESCEMRVELEDHDGNKVYAKYDSFQVADATDYYRLSLGSYSGTAGNTVILLDFSLTVKAATFIFISGCGSAISYAKEGKSGFIYNLVKRK